MSKKDRLTARQRRFVWAMLTARTVRDAAKMADVAEATAYRYLRLAHVRHAVHRLQSALLGQEARAAAAEMPDALSTLVGIHKDTEQPAAARVTAARAIRDNALDLADRVTILERLDLLEEAVDGTDN